MTTALLVQPAEAAATDTYITNTAATTNYGNEVLLLCGTVHVAGVDSYSRTLIEFDITGLPNALAMTNAVISLRMATNGIAAGGGTFTVYGLTRTNWTETGVTWNKYDGTTNWTTAGGDYTATSSTSGAFTSADTNIQLSVEQLIYDAKAAGQSVLNIILVGPEIVGSSNYVALRSSGDSTANLRPALSVTYNDRESDVDWTAPVRRGQWTTDTRKAHWTVES